MNTTTDKDNDNTMILMCVFICLLMLPVLLYRLYIPPSPFFFFNTSLHVLLFFEHPPHSPRLNVLHLDMLFCFRILSIFMVQHMIEPWIEKIIIIIYTCIFSFQFFVEKIKKRVEVNGWVEMSWQCQIESYQHFMRVTVTMRRWYGFQHGFDRDVKIYNLFFTFCEIPHMHPKI
jgi:hypothetical protein